MGGKLKGEGIYVYLWVIHVEVWQKTTKFCKAIILQFKKKKAETSLCQQKSIYSQSYDFSSSHAWIWELDHKEGWALKNWCFWVVGLEMTLESPLSFKEIKSINPKGNQPWILIGKTDTEAEALIHWPPDGKKKLTRKDPAAGKDWGQEEKRVTEDKMIR